MRFPMRRFLPGPFLPGMLMPGQFMTCVLMTGGRCMADFMGMVRRRRSQHPLAADNGRGQRNQQGQAQQQVQTHAHGWNVAPSSAAWSSPKKRPVGQTGQGVQASSRRLDLG